MDIIYFNKSFSIPDCVLTVGSFDGLHRGHQKIIETINRHANTLNTKSGLITFEPHPRHILFPNLETKVISTFEEKVILLNLQKQRPDYLIVIPFKKSLSAISGKDFLKNIIQKHFHPKGLVIGYNHHFGKNRDSSAEETQKFCIKNQLLYEFVSEVKTQGNPLSSTTIRKLICEGDLETANEKLGYPFCIYGTVRKGTSIGKELGFATANLDFDASKKILPNNGVYATKVKLDNQILDGVLNLGYKPSIQKEAKLSLEVHILDFNKNIYNKELTVFFIEKIRKEFLFEDRESLKSQILKDCTKARTILKSNIDFFKKT